MGIKVCVIGGGSSYTPELIEGFIKRYHELPVSEIHLVDCEMGAKKLDIICALAKRMVQKTNLPIDIRSTLNRKEGLLNADFVITQIRVGGLDARIKDESITQKYGILGQETNGPAGMFKALRTIPVILDICKDIEAYCPDAWLINFTNPAGIVTEAVLNYSNIKKIVGVCNVPVNLTRHIARVLDASQERVDVRFAGLNHLSCGVEIYLDGTDVTSTALELFANDKDQQTMKNVDPINWDTDFVKALGFLPSPYHRYFYMHKEMLSKASLKNEVRAETVKKVEKRLFEVYSDLNLDIKPKELEDRGGAYYSDASCNLISSIYNNKCDIQTVNTKNLGSISGIGCNNAVEVSCVITKSGPKPLTFGALPPQAFGLISLMKSFETLVCECAVSGDKSKGVLALTINPFVQDATKAKQLFDELFEAHKEYLTNF